jgi:hypothetical protein
MKAICRIIIGFWTLSIACGFGCTQESGKNTMQTQKEQTSPYGIGRFVIDIPAGMEYREGSYRMRYCELNEIAWQSMQTHKAVQEEWEKRAAEIEKSKPPKGREKVIIDRTEFTDIGKWCKGIFYYKESMSPNRGFLDLLLDAGATGLWLKFSADANAREKIYPFVTEIAKAYRAPSHPYSRVEVIPDRDAFYLQYGAIDLPFEYKESTDVIFRGHALDETLELNVETVVVDEVEEFNASERLTAMLASNFIPGLKIDKIRSGERDIAGMKGEEIIVRLKEDGETTIRFGWGYSGQLDSAHQPRIKISIATQESRLEEKIALWDSILNSFRPAGR